MSKGKRVFVGYARTSGQEEKNGQRLQDQIERIRSIAVRQDIQLAQVYFDGGNGTQSRSFRAGIFTLLDQIDAMQTTDVVVLSSDRLIHDGEVGRQILKELERARINIVSLTEDANKVRQDTRRITSTSVAALKSASTKIEALKRGKAPAGRAAYGYRREPVEGESTTRLRVVEEEAKTVQWIFREYLRKRSMAKVAEGLAERRIPAPGGKEWSRATVAWILGNEIYIGLVKFGSERGKGEHTPIVEPLLFTKVQQMRETNRRTRRLSRRTASASGSDTSVRVDGAAGIGEETDAARESRLDLLSALDREALEAAERGETIDASNDEPGRPAVDADSREFELAPVTEEDRPADETQDA